MPPRLTLAPDECSEGTKPRYAISCRALAKRRKSPTSATTVTATTRATPRIACSAVTTGAIDQFGSSSSICRVSRSTRAFAVLDGVNVVLQHDLLRRMGKPYRGQPAPAPAFAQPRRQLDENLGTVLKHPDLAHRTAAATLGNRDANRRPPLSRGQACAHPTRPR